MCSVERPEFKCSVECTEFKLQNFLCGSTSLLLHLAVPFSLQESLTTLSPLFQYSGSLVNSLDCRLVLLSELELELELCWVMFPFSNNTYI